MNLTKKSTREDLIAEMLKLKLFVDGRGNIYCPQYDQHLSGTTMECGNSQMNLPIF
jgi:hypothetical protein